MRRHFSFFIFAVAAVAHGQFVYPKPNEHQQKVPRTYAEDPFITKYRQKFFAVFRGDLKTFNEGYAEIEAMIKKDPKDARALVWLGNGQTIKAGQLYMMGQKEPALKLLDVSRKTLDAAVALQPKDYNIYMMRAATLFVQGQYFPASAIPKANWEKLRDDCLSLIRDFGAEKLAKSSVHVRGEAYGELGIAYARLGEKAKARAAFQKVAEQNPGTAYEERAKREIAALDGK
jgi:tetratricopeptide (TPR) repeat protein